MTEDLHDIRARQEYEAIRGFYVHVMVFVPVMLLLVVLDVLAERARGCNGPVSDGGSGWRFTPTRPLC